MAAVNVQLTNFTAGELSPRMKGRSDVVKYYNGCDTMLNMVTQPQGGATRRPGTLYVYNDADQAHPCRLVEFIYSTLQAYVLEFSNLKVRVFANGGAVLNGAATVDIAVPYTYADLATLKFVQSADTLYIVHPNYPPATLTRSSNTSWTYSTITFLDGPYLDTNVTSNEVTPSGYSGNITLTWDSTDNINGGAGFTAADVGRLVRVQLYSLWSWCLITAVTNPTTVTAAVQSKVNYGAQGVIDGAPWTGDTLYETGALVSNGGQYYRATSGGISAPVGTPGPNGTGETLVDGSVVWACAGSLNAEAYAQYTTYVPGACVIAGGTYYICQVGGTTDGSTGAPSGTGANLTGGAAGMLWYSTEPLTFPTKTKNWAIGRWGGANGWPMDVKFNQQRLTFFGYAGQPNVICASQPGDFLNMAPTLADGTVTNASALVYVLDDDEVNAVRWVSQAGSAQAASLGIGTDSGEHILQAAYGSGVLSATSQQAYRETSYGAALNVNALRIGKCVLFVDKTARKLREWAFYWQNNGFTGPDLLEFSEHITRGPVGSDPSQNGMAQLVYQQAPNQVVWTRTKGGKLIGFTYDRDQQIFAPHQHQLGGNYYGGPPLVESIACIPSPDGSYDQLWLSVCRTINGSVVRTIEVMMPYFDAKLPDDAVFVDCAFVSAPRYLAANVTPTGFVNTALAGRPPSYTGTATIAADAAVFAAADVGAVIRLNGGKLVVTAFTDTQHLQAQVIAPMQSLAPAAANAWSCTRPQATFTGLDLLDGETVQVLGDGGLRSDCVVAAGAITLTEPAAQVAVGYNCNPVLVTMPAIPRTQIGDAAQGKAKRVITLWARFHESIGCKYGRRITDSLTDAQKDSLEELRSRQAGNPMDNVPPLFSGSRRLSTPGGYDNEGQFIVTQDGPLPLTVLSFSATVDVNEAVP